MNENDAPFGHLKPQIMIKVYTLNKKGKIHDNHCEDHLIVRNLDGPWLLGAVMDGCSSGIESHFASGLVAKIINRACGDLLMKANLAGMKEEYEKNLEMIGRFILEQVWDTIPGLKKMLSLHIHELLSTLILLVYNKDHRAAWINISGDGFIAVDDRIEEIDQDNMPDYMAYHLGDRFDDWIESHSKTFSIKYAENLAISTDGVAKFHALSQRSPVRIDPVNYLLVDAENASSPEMLEDKVKPLATEYGLYPYDELGIVRILNTLPVIT